ncbi:MAG: hypothetical protein ABID38_03940 [Candidatus Diapherotrites archaeon]
MVNKEVVLSTVKKMYESGIDDETVKSTLRDIGLEEGEIKSIINEVKGGIPSGEEPDPSEKDPVAGAGEVPASGEDINQQIAGIREDHDLANTTTQTQFEEHAQKVDEVHRRVDDLHAKIDSSTQSDLSQRLQIIDRKMNTLEADLGEVKANTSALKSILEKILETNRKILLGKK